MNKSSDDPNPILSIDAEGFLLWWGMFGYAMVQFYDEENKKKYDMNFFLVALWWMPSEIRFLLKEGEATTAIPTTSGGT